MTKNLLLLLADDDADDRDIFRDALAELEPAVTLAMVPDGKAATQYLEDCADEAIPTAVLLDYNMPHLNGPQVLHWLCSRPRFDGMIKFVWSTAAQKEYIDGCKEKGAVEYFIKPNSEKGLHEMIAKMMAICLEMGKTG